MMEETFSCNLCREELNDAETLQNHNEVCDYRTVLCDNNCGVSTYRCEINEHITTKCTMRSVECKECKEKYVAISMKDHYKFCPKMMVECPKNCDVIIVQRELLNLHLESVCSVNTVPCKFKYAQCEFRGTHIALEKHLKESYEHHIELLGTMVVELSQQLIQTQKRLKNTVETLNWSEEKIYETQNTVLRLETKVNELEIPRGIFEWNIRDWNVIRRKSYIESSDFYTSQNGYKLKIWLWPNGIGAEKTNHMSIYLYILPGLYDKQLSWPFRQKLTVTLLNQTGDDNLDKIVDFSIPNNDREISIFKSDAIPPKASELLLSYYKFISLEEFNDKFVKRNTIYFTIKSEDI